jgi:hypothetical protein
VHHAYDVWGPARDELIARAKVVLNLHYYEAAIFEQVRVSYLLNNEALVISESSEFVPYRITIDDSLTGEISAAIKLHGCGCGDADSFKRLPMVKILQEVI